MGAWSQYPDGNDSNIDIFGNFIQRYFTWSEEGNEDLYNINDEDKYNPGLEAVMGLRTGASPIFSNSDLGEENMEVYYNLLKMYSEKMGSNTVVGLAISLARVLNNESFGIFGDNSKGMPLKNVLSEKINKFILDNIENIDYDYTNKQIRVMKKFFDKTGIFENEIDTETESDTESDNESNTESK